MKQPSEQLFYRMWQPVVSFHQKSGILLVSSQSIFERVSLDIVLQPIAESRVRLCIEINHMGRLRLVIVTADHIEIQISFHIPYLR